jgi:hypothetical protein
MKILPNDISYFKIKHMILRKILLSLVSAKRYFVRLSDIFYDNLKAQFAIFYIVDEDIERLHPEFLLSFERLQKWS